MIEYDKQVIGEFAERLYAKARSAVRAYTMLGLLIGFVSGVAIDQRDGLVILLFVVLGGFLGYLLGKEKAFWYKLQAQTALCQAQIEMNTRK